MATPVMIPAGLQIPTMIPLDSKLYFRTKIQMADLGQDNNNAYRYYDKMVALCCEDSSYYMWMERPAGYTEPGLLGPDFIYPAGVIVDSIAYSGKSYNFFNYFKYWFSINPGVVTPNLGFKYNSNIYKITDADEQPLVGDYQPNTFVSTDVLPYKVKARLNVFYVEQEETLLVTMKLTNAGGNVLFQETKNVVLPLYPGEFESPPFVLPALDIGLLYNLVLTTVQVGLLDPKTTTKQFRLT